MGRILLSLFTVTIVSALPSKPMKDQSLYFDRSTPDYETVLTPADFELASQMADSLQLSEGDIWDSDAMYGKNRFEGDIANEHLNASTVELFINGGNINDKSGVNQFNAIKNRHQLWPNGRIPYTISSQYSSYSRSMIAASMNEYSTHTCIKWVPKEPNDVNYVHVFPDRGCYSMVGKMGGKQQLSLGSGCIQKGIIIHELMHAVGFFHEQSRTDRDDFITILWNNIQPGMQGQFEKYGHGTIQSLGAEYDYSSIMHYGNKAFSRNGQPTIVPKKTGVSIGQRGGFSKTDADKINKLYGCSGPDKPATSIPTTAAPATTTRATITYRPYPGPPTLPPQPAECKNTRGDCDDLASQGWCQRNPGWMRQHCPISCGMCKPSTTAPPPPPPTTRPPSPSSTLPPPQPVVTGDCDDLRVDCEHLMKQRYCKTAPTFMKGNCARTCGFCFKPIPTEVPDPLVGGGAVTGRPTLITAQPLVTFWRTSTTQPPAVTATVPPTPHPCSDKKHFCSHWKGAGFCEGIFAGYMKKNCPASCGLC